MRSSQRAPNAQNVAETARDEHEKYRCHYQAPVPMERTG